MQLLLAFALVLGMASSTIQKINNFDNAINGYIFSPCYYANYSNDLSVTYNITVPDSHYLQLTFLVFHTEPVVDVLSVYDGTSSASPLLQYLSGGHSGLVLTSSGNNLFLDFETDLEITDRGFYARFDAIPIGSTPELLTGCPQSYYATSTFQSITSPNWPRNYSTNIDCPYLLNVDPGMRVKLLIETFDTEHYDYLQIYDGPDTNSTLLAELRDQPATPLIYGSSTNQMLLVFSSDLINTAPGFSAVFWPESSSIPCDSKKEAREAKHLSRALGLNT